MAEPAKDSENPTELVKIRLSVTKGVLRRYDTLVDFGFFPSRDEALRQGLLDSMRFSFGSYYNIRVDTEKRVEPDVDPEVDADAPADAGN